MDGRWILPILPTECDGDSDALRTEFKRLFPEFKTLTSETQPFFVDQVRALTFHLRKHGYCPSSWTSRAYNLLRLGYPELAIGDAFKAQSLVNSFLNEKSKEIEVAKELWRQAKTTYYFKSGEAYQHEEKARRLREYAHRISDRSALVLAQALFKAHCYVECYELLKEYVPKLDLAREGIEKLKSLADRACVIEDVTRMQERDWVETWNKASLEQKRSGTINPQVYPWMAPFLQRDGVILLEAEAKVSNTTQEKCRLATSTIVSTVPMTDEIGSKEKPKTLGIFAKQDFAIGETIMIDKTALSGVVEQADRCSCCRGLSTSMLLQQFQAPCCGAPFCSAECRETSMAQYHFPECINLADLKNSNMALFINYASEDTIAMNDLLYRVLAHAENSPLFFPLRVPAIGAMTPAHRSNQPILFSVINDIQRPLQMLKNLGINCFTDHAYDTWVIQTIQARIRNNVRIYEDDHDQYHAALNLSFMFFNHSCVPNVDIEIPPSGSSNIEVKAIKAIKSGEELFIAYIDDNDLKLPHDERQEHLKTWMEKCQCRRCHTERIGAGLPPTPTVNLDDPNDNDFCIDDDQSMTSGPPSPDSLADEHPAIKTLRSRVFDDQFVNTFDWDRDVELPLSPSRTRGR